MRRLVLDVLYFVRNARDERPEALLKFRRVADQAGELIVGGEAAEIQHEERHQSHKKGSDRARQANARQQSDERFQNEREDDGEDRGDKKHAAQIENGDDDTARDHGQSVAAHVLLNHTGRRLAARSDYQDKTACSLRLARRKYNRSVISRGRILALDLGRKRIGLALSDELGLTAQGLETMDRVGRRDDIEVLRRLTVEKSVKLIVVGDPVHMSGEASRQSEYTREFARELEYKTGLPVKFWDERWTSREAERVLRGSGIAHDQRKPAIDRLSAVILLQSYLDSARPEPAA